MGSVSHEQRRLDHRGRSFLFVSYDAEDPRASKTAPARGPTWYLVSSNNRWPAVPYRIGQPLPEVDALCIAWLEDVVFAPAAPASPAKPPVQRFLTAESGPESPIVKPGA